MIKTIKVATAFTLGVSTLSTTTLSASAVTYKVNKQGKLVNSKGKLVKGFKKYKNLLYKDSKKFTGIRSNNYYKAGKLATGDYKSIFYSKGVAYTGIAKNSKKYAGLYVKKGKPSTGDYKNVYYVVGKKYTGIAKKSKLYKNQYVKNGKPGTGILAKKQYVKGKLVSGKYGKYVYVNGMKAQDLYKEVFYENGLVATGIASNNLYYVKGDLATGEYNDVYYTDGIVTMSKEELALQKARTALTDAQLVVQETKAQLVALLLLEQQLKGEATELQVTKQLQKLATTDEIASFITELKEKDLAHLTAEEKETYLVQVVAYKKEVLAKLQAAVESIVSNVVELNKCIQQSLEAGATIEQLTAIYEQLAEVLKVVKASVQDVEGIDVDFSKADEALQLVRETLGITLQPEVEEPVEVKPPTNTGNTGGSVPVQSIRVTSIDTLAPITIVNGENPLLPSTVNVVTTTNNTTFPIIWNTPTNFNPTIAGEYTFTGTFIIPTGYVLTSGMTNQVSVKVIVDAKVLTEAEKTTVAEDAVNALFTNANKEAIAKNVSAEIITEAKTKVEALASNNTERVRLLEDIKKATSFLLEISTDYANSTTIVHVRMPNAANDTKVRIEIFNDEGSSVYSDEAKIQNGKLDLSISSGTIADGSGYVVKVTANTLTASSEPFIIDTIAPKITGVVDGQATQQNITPITQDTDIATVELTKNKVSIKDYKLGTELTGEGQYSLEVADEAGNKTKVEFRIDRTAPEMKYGQVDESSGMMTVHFSEELAVFDGMTVKKLVDGDKVPGTFTVYGMDTNDEYVSMVQQAEYDVKQKAVILKVQNDISYIFNIEFEQETSTQLTDLAGNIFDTRSKHFYYIILENAAISSVKRGIKAALRYVYTPTYTYKGIFELSKDSSNVTMKYDQSTGFQSEDILDDLNHYLGALHKTENSSIGKITFNNKEYRWNESSTSLDSKWESEGTSLTEVIKAERNQLNENGLSLTLHNKGDEGVVNVIFKPFTFDSLPTLIGVTDGQILQSITPTTKDTDIATVVLTKNGVTMEAYKLGTELTEEGKYSLEVTDKAGNKTTVGFQIDRTAPIIAGVVNGQATQQSITPTTKDTDIATVVLTKNGVTMEAYKLGTELTEEGKYSLEVTDKAGNKTTVGFQIDRTAPIIAGVVNGQATQQNITPTTQDTDIATVVLTKGGASIKDYKLGTELTEEGLYSLEVTDKAGNKTKVDFQIDRTAPSIKETRFSPDFQTMTVYFTEDLAMSNGTTVIALSNGYYANLFTVMESFDGMEEQLLLESVIYDSNNRCLMIRAIFTMSFYEDSQYTISMLNKSVVLSDLAGNKIKEAVYGNLIMK